MKIIVFFAILAHNMIAISDFYRIPYTPGYYNHDLREPVDPKDPSVLEHVLVEFVGHVTRETDIPDHETDIGKDNIALPPEITPYLRVTFMLQPITLKIRLRGPGNTFFIRDDKRGQVPLKVYLELDKEYSAYSLRRLNRVQLEDRYMDTKIDISFVLFTPYEKVIREKASDLDFTFDDIDPFEESYLNVYGKFTTTSVNRFSRFENEPEAPLFTRIRDMDRTSGMSFWFMPIIVNNVVRLPEEDEILAKEKKTYAKPETQLNANDIFFFPTQKQTITKEELEKQTRDAAIKLKRERLEWAAKSQTERDRIELQQRLDKMSAKMFSLSRANLRRKAKEGGRYREYERKLKDAKLLIA